LCLHLQIVEVYNCRRQQQSHCHLLKELAIEAQVGRDHDVAFKVSLCLTMKQFDPEDKGITIFQNVMRLEINGMEKGYATHPEKSSTTLNTIVKLLWVFLYNTTAFKLLVTFTILTWLSLSITS